MKIIELDGYAANPGDLSWDSIKSLGDFTFYDRTLPEQVVCRAEDADIVLTNKVVLSAEVMDKLPKLKYIGVLATGYNVVDVDAAKKRGIVVTNIPSYSTDSVAQLTFAHILNIISQVDYYSSQNRAGRWSRNLDFCYWDAPMHELSGMTLGVVGLGNIGMRVATIAHDFGMKVLAYTSKEKDKLPDWIYKKTLNELFSTSDIISLHCPLTPDTQEIINKDSILKMKHGVIIINTGRGPLVNEQDVADALTCRTIGAYGADVMIEEPPSKDNPLFRQPMAFLTPHIGWATIEARKRLMDIAAENIKAFIEGNPQNVVNK